MFLLSVAFIPALYILVVTVRHALSCLKQRISCKLQDSHCHDDSRIQPWIFDTLETIKELETLVVDLYQAEYPCTILKPTIDWVTVNRDTRLHRVHIPGCDSLAPPFLLIHGIASCSIDLWASNMQNLRALSSEIHMIDLPGFGLSSPYPISSSNSTTALTTEPFCSSIASYVETHMNRKRPVVVGHSFGAFIALNCAAKYPGLFHAIVMVSPVGIFPCLGGAGAWWGIFFKLGLPTSIVQVSGKMGQILLGMILIILSSRPLFLAKSRLIFRVLRSTPYVPIVGRFICLTPISVGWRAPMLQEILNLPIPASFIFGQDDSITPVHMGTMVSKLSGIPCYQVDGAWHSPITEFPDRFIEALRMSLTTATTPRKLSPQALALINSIDWNQFHSPYDRSIANEYIKSKLYRFLSDISELPTP